MTTTDKPELLTQYMFVSLRANELKDAGIENVHSLSRTMESQSIHLLAVTNALKAKQPIHAENLYQYRKLFPAMALLRQYSINGNLAVYDSAKVLATLEDQRRALAYVSPSERREMERNK